MAGRPRKPLLFCASFNFADWETMLSPIIGAILVSLIGQGDATSN